MIASLVFPSLTAIASADDWSIKGPPPPGWRGEGVVKTPESSVAKPDDGDRRNHTNTKVFVPSVPSTPNNQPGTAGSGQAPASDTTPR